VKGIVEMVGVGAEACGVVVGLAAGVVGGMTVILGKGVGVMGVGVGGGVGQSDRLSRGRASSCVSPSINWQPVRAVRMRRVINQINRCFVITILPQNMYFILNRSYAVGG
jgi:hypothetical protein